MAEKNITSSQADKNKKIKLIIHSSRDNHSAKIVPVGFGSADPSNPHKIYIIKIGEEVEVPLGVKEVLDNALETDERELPDGTTERFEYKRYNYTVVS